MAELRNDPEADYTLYTYTVLPIRRDVSCNQSSSSPNTPIVVRSQKKANQDNSFRHWEDIRLLYGEEKQANMIWRKPEASFNKP